MDVFANAMTTADNSASATTVANFPTDVMAAVDEQDDGMVGNFESEGERKRKSCESERKSMKMGK